MCPFSAHTTPRADPPDTLRKDGADIDYEDFAAMNGGTGESWLITFTTTLRAALPAPYISEPPPFAPATLRALFRRSDS